MRLPIAAKLGFILAVLAASAISLPSETVTKQDPKTLTAVPRTPRKNHVNKIVENKTVLAKGNIPSSAPFVPLSSSTVRIGLRALGGIRVWNGELETYRKFDAYISSKGSLVIRTDSNYDSGCVVSDPFLYGTVTFIARFPQGKGLLSSVWMRPEDGGIYPEIDIIELLGQYPSRAYMVYHESKRNYSRYRIYRSNMASKFHKIRLVWNSKSLTWYINGKMRYRISGPEVPREPMYLRVNTAVGGQWPGKPQGIKFPQYFMIKSLDIQSAYWGSGGKRMSTVPGPN